MKTVRTSIHKFIFLLILLPMLCNAQITKTWTGSTSGDWFTAANWTPQIIPATTDSVLVPGSRPNYPVLTGDVQIRSIRFQSASSFTLNGHSLTLSHNLIVDISYTGIVCLSMNDPADVIVVNQHCTLGGRNSLTNGTVYIKGNLTQNAVANALQSEGTQFVFNGSTVQNVNLSHPADAYFKDMTLSAGSLVTFNSDIRIQGRLTLEENSRLTQSGSLETYYDVLMPQLGLSSVYDVANTYVRGDVALTEDCTLPLATNHLFIPSGPSRKLTFNHHRLSVGGNVSVLPDYSADNHLVMQFIDDTLEVGGNLNVGGPNSFIDGVVMVKGNISHTAVAAAMQAQNTRFVLNGSTAQTFSMYSGGYLNDMELSEDAQVTFNSNVDIHGLLLMKENAVLNQSNAYRINYTNRLPRLQPGAAYNVYNTYVAGNIILDEGCDLLNSISNVIIPAGENRSLRLDGQTLTIGGNLDIRDDYSDNVHILMINTSDRLVIQGDAEFSGRNNLQAGTIELRGNLMQNGDAYALQPVGTQFVLNGNGNQTINIQSSAYNQSFLYDLVIENPNTIMLNNHLYIKGQLIASGRQSVIAGSGNRLQCKGVDVSELTFDNTLLFLDSNQFTRFDNVIFQNYSTAANQWVINCLQMEDTVRNLRFLTTPTTGKYIVGNDPDGAATSSRLVVVDALPQYGLDKTAASGGFVIQWMNSPIAVTDEIAINEDESSVINVTNNDSDPDGDDIMIDEIIQPLHGTSEIINSDSISYTPVIHYFGSDSFYYRLRDASGLFNWGKVIITILALNDSPSVTASLSNVSYPEDFGRVFIADLNDVFDDVDNPDLTFNVMTLDSGITADISTDSLNINSALNFNGQVEFYVSASDDEYAVYDTFTVTVTPVNDWPFVANPIANVTYPENFGRVFIADLNNVFDDVDNPDLTFSVEALGSGVTADISADSLYINSILNFNGQVEFDVIASDGYHHLYHTFTVSVTPVNGQPMTFALLLPADGDTISNQSSPIVFTWNASVDADGDALTYDLFVSGPYVDTVITEIIDTTLSFQDLTRFTKNSNYSWWVLVNDDEFTISSVDTFVFYYPELVTVREDQNKLPNSFALFQNYPNPFNPSTTIKFDLPLTEHVVLSIFNILGHKVSVIINSKLNAGKYTILWNGKNDNGQNVASGIYLFKFKAGNYSSTRKMILIR